MALDASGAPIRRFTADEAVRMSEAGILGDDEHFELLDGRFVDCDPATGDEIIRRFTGDEAIHMAELGVIREDERVELLDGALVEMSPQGVRHAAAVRRVAKRLRRVYGEALEVSEEKPLAASPTDMPEPDIALVRPRDDDYATHHPTGADTLLVVEIASSSHGVDRRKAAIYASAGVAVYWLVDLAKRRLEVRARPAAGQYRYIRVIDEDDSVGLPETVERLSVRDLLPP